MTTQQANTQQTTNEGFPSAATFELDNDQMRVAVRVQQIIDAKDDKGNYKYTNDEVRAFMCACIFELGIPMSRELNLVMNRFLLDLDIESKEPTAEEVLAAVRAYFEANPLNEELNKAFQELGRDEMFKSKEGFSNDGAKRNAALASAGLSAQRRAPRMQQRKAPGGKPKLKRGLG